MRYLCSLFAFTIFGCSHVLPAPTPTIQHETRVLVLGELRNPFYAPPHTDRSPRQFMMVRNARLFPTKGVHVLLIQRRQGKVALAVPGISHPFSIKCLRGERPNVRFLDGVRPTSVMASTAEDFVMGRRYLFSKKVKSVSYVAECVVPLKG